MPFDYVPQSGNLGNPLEEVCLSGDSWRSLIFILVLAVCSAVISYARGYIEAQNSKKLERDSEENKIKGAKKMLALFEKKEEQLKEALWSAQMLLLVVESALFGSFSLGLLGDLGLSLENGLPSLLVAMAAGLIYAFLYIVFVRRLFSTVGTARGRKTTAYKSLPLIRILHGISLPFYFVCHLFSLLFVKLFGINTQVEDEDQMTHDEILTLVDIGEESGALESEEKEMIENVLEFTDSTAGELLTHRTKLTAVELSTKEEDLLAIIEDSGYSRIPVYEEEIDNIVGILSTRLYLLNQRKPKKEQKSLKELLFAPHFVPESVHATNLLSDMKKNKIHMAVVVDEYGGTAGIITMEDLLEEIVGKIYDETDDPVSEDANVVLLSENLWRVKGSVILEELEEALGITFPEDVEFETMAGMVLSTLTVIPDEGTQPEADCFGLHVKVEKIKERRVESVLVSLIPEEDPADDKEKEKKESDKD
jgi:putative hemolysin